jgi:hypothetical protein
MGWLMTLVLIIAAAMLPIAVGQAQAQEAQGEQTETCSLPKGWDPAEDLPRILKEHHEWFARWSHNNFSWQWEKDHPEGRANLCNAALRQATLTKADLTGTDLTGATLTEATLIGADLTEVILSEARLGFADLTGATYAPVSPPPDSYLEGIKGLSTITFPESSGSGLVQLRELLQKAQPQQSCYEGPFGQI